MRFKATFILVILFLIVKPSKSQNQLLSNIGHTDIINSVSFSPDGKFIVSGGKDKILRLWNVETEKVLRIMKGHNEGILCVDYSPDGKYAASAEDGYYVKIWDVQTGELLRDIYKPRLKVTSVLFNSDGSEIIVGYFDQNLRIYDVKSGKEKETINVGTDVNVMQPNAGRSMFVVAGNGKKNLKLYNESGKNLQNFKTSKWIEGVGISPGGNYIASGNHDETLDIWKSNGKLIKTLNIGRVVRNITFTKDEKNLVFADGPAVRIYNIEKEEFINVLQEKETEENMFQVYGAVSSIQVNPSGNQLLTANHDKELKIWDIKSGEVLQVFGKSNACKINDIHVSSDGKYLISAGNDHYARTWDLEHGGQLKILKGDEPGRANRASIQNVILTPGGKELIMGNYHEKLLLVDRKSGEQLHEFKGIKEKTSSIDLSPNGKYFLTTTAATKPLKIWDLERKRVSQEIWEASLAFEGVYSPNGRHIATAQYSEENVVYIWDAQNGEKLFSMQGHQDYPKCVAFNDKGDLLASGGLDNKVIVWDAINGKKKFELKGHSSPVSSVAFSPGGKYVFSGSEANKIIMWDLSNRKVMKTLQGHYDAITNLIFTPSGKYLISAAKDGAIKYWNSKTGEPVVTIMPLKNTKDYIVLTPDGRFDGTEKGMQELYYVDGMQTIPLSSYFEYFFTPNLLTLALNNKLKKLPKIDFDNLKKPPLVEIISPVNNSRLGSSEINVKVKATAREGGIEEMRLYVNEKLVETKRYDNKGDENDGNVKTHEFNISLINGKNIIKATALNDQKTESRPGKIVSYFNGVDKRANLHLLVIGVNNYKNPSYNLNYALADAKAFKKALEIGSKDIFQSMNVMFLKDDEVTSDGITKVFQRIKKEAQQEDVVVFYYAGHGVMDETEDPQFHIVPYDVTQMYGNPEMLKSKGISAKQLQKFSTEIKAQKQLFVIDACQSGGMADLLATRGAAVEEAIAQLAKRTGTYWLTASTSEQFATEFEELGHGLFTYCILQALKGKADTGSKDHKITVEEISSFLNDKVPELSKKYKGASQYPTSYGFGQDFPISIIKNN